MEAVYQTCDGSILMSEDGKHGKCEFCGNEYYFREPKSSAVIMALNEANAIQTQKRFRQRDNKIQIGAYSGKRRRRRVLGIGAVRIRN